MTAPADTEFEAVQARLEKLESEAEGLRDHRTRVQTLLGLAGAAAIVVVLGAVSVRDATLAVTARVAAAEQRLAALEAVGSRREVDDRASSAAIVRLQATVETLQSTLARRLDVIEQRLAQPVPASHR